MCVKFSRTKDNSRLSSVYDVREQDVKFPACLSVNFYVHFLSRFFFNEQHEMCKNLQNSILKGYKIYNRKKDAWSKFRFTFVGIWKAFKGNEIPFLITALGYTK